MTFTFTTGRVPRLVATQCAFVILLVLMPQHLSARQSAAPEGAATRFEVVSVKPTLLSSPQGVRVLPPSFMMPSASLQTLIGYAYMMPTSRVLGGEEWTRTERFEVRALAPQQSFAGVSIPQGIETVRRMVKSLLSERFALRVTEERRLLPAYVLRIKDPKRGNVPGLRPPDAECERTRLDALALTGPVKAPDARQGPLPPARYCTLAVGTKGDLVTLHGNNTTMTELLVVLEVLLGAPVQDETGIQGRFGLDVAFGKGQVPMFGGLSVDANVPDGPSIASAFADSVNISIHREQRPVPVVVVTSAQRPTPD